jgi:hypothetical protein
MIIFLPNSITGSGLSFAPFFTSSFLSLMDIEVQQWLLQRLAMPVKEAITA